MNKPSLEGAVIFCLAATLVILNSSPFMTSGQRTSTCRNEYDSTLVVQCVEEFISNHSDINALINVNKSGEIPSPHTLETYLELICRLNIQKNVVPCIDDVTKDYKKKTTCSWKDRKAVSDKGSLLKRNLDKICPCEDNATQTIKQCFTEIEIDPDTILTPNASITEDKSSLVGWNEHYLYKVCKNRQMLFSCLSPVSETCPSLIRRLKAVGINFQDMENVTKISCATRDRLACFQEASENVYSCGDNTTKRKLKDSLIGSFQQGFKLPSITFCRQKLKQIQCQLEHFERSCDDTSIKLWLTIECVMLPLLCQTKPPLKKYGEICGGQVNSTKIPKVMTTQHTPINLTTENKVTVMPSLTTQRQPTEAKEQSQTTVLTEITEGTESIQSTDQTRQNETTGQTQPIVTKDQTQPNETTGKTQPNETTGQTQPIVITDQSQPVVTTDQTQPVVTTDQTQPFVTTDQTQPVVTTDQTQPVVTTDQTRPYETTDQIQPNKTTNQTNPIYTTGQKQETEISEPIQTTVQSQPNRSKESTQSLIQTPWLTNNISTPPTPDITLPDPFFYCDGAASVTVSMVLLVNAAGIWSLL